jgi:putative membrane protein
MMLAMLAFWAVVVVGIVALLRWTATPQPRHQEETTSAPSGKARAVLDERFARGDIDEVEYASRLATLRGKA